MAIAGVGTIEPIYDLAGNLLYDGTYCFQYDAWNRLCQVNQATTQPMPGGEPGELQIAPGKLVKQFMYDGLGRLVRAVSPYPEPTTNPTEVRTERFYYDGVRRVQEVITDPLMNMMMAAGSGEQSAAAALAANPEIEGEGLTLESESNQLNGEGSTPPGGGPALAREYIWGPGDSPTGSGVDELLVQFASTGSASGAADQTAAAVYTLQDVGGDIIAACDLGGASSSARVVRQISYDAYGSVLAAETLHTHAPLHVGHKGLFFDRLDTGVVDPNTSAENERFESGTSLLGYVRNRTLHCDLGRWLQRDPNATGMNVQVSFAFHGHAIFPDAMPFNIGAHFQDGMNVLVYCGSNTHRNNDASGLFFTIGDVLGAGSWQTELQETSADELGEVRNTISEKLGPLFGEYAFEQLLDLNWTSDWAEPDDLYRGSAEWSTGTGSWSGLGGNASTPGTGSVVASDSSMIPKIIGKMDSGAVGMGVYIVLDKDGNFIYAGRTKNLAVRMKKSVAERGGAYAVGIAVNAKCVRRALEDLLIRELDLIKNGANKINGMSDTVRNSKKGKDYCQDLRKMFGKLI